MRRFLTSVMMVMLAACGEDPVLIPAVPTTISRVGDEVGTPGWRLATPLTIRVLDNTGAPVANAAVEWSTDEVEAWLGATSSTTDADGLASVAFAPGWRVGAQKVRVAIGAFNADVMVEVSALRLEKVAFGASGHGCGIDEAGKVWCIRGVTGSDRFEEPRPLPNTARPVALDPGIAYLDIAIVGWQATERFCGLTSTNALRCWAYSEPSSPPIPSEVATPVPFVQVVGSTAGTLCGLDADRVAWCQGPNQRGQLGDGTTTDRATFAPVSGTQRFRVLAAGSEEFCALDLDALAWCWGRGNPLIPTRMAGDLRFRTLAFSLWSPCGLGLADNLLRCWWKSLLEGSPVSEGDALLVPSGGPLLELTGNGNLAISRWPGGRIGFAGDLVHSRGVFRFVRRPTDLPLAGRDDLPPMAGGFTALISTGDDWWCANQELGATLCAKLVNRLAAIPRP